MSIPTSIRRSRAFSLLELMVALAIFMMVVITIYSTWILIVRSSVIAQSAAAQAQRERIAIRTVEHSLMCVQSFQASMKYYSFDVENGSEPVFSFTARLPDTFPRSGKFGDFNVRRLTYTVEPGADQFKNLVLRQSPILMDMDADEKETPLVLARNIKDFKVECWDTNQMDWATEWDNTNAIPPLVRVTFTLGSRDENGLAGPDETMSRVVALPCNTLPAGMQMPGGMPAGGGPGAGIPQVNPTQ